MEITFFATQNLLLALSTKGAWIPSQGFLFLVLVFGALLTAGVALSVLTFYEDHYWGDESFREELRLNPSRRQPSAFQKH